MSDRTFVVILVILVILMVFMSALGKVQSDRIQKLETAIEQSNSDCQKVSRVLEGIELEDRVSKNKER